MKRRPLSTLWDSGGMGTNQGTTIPGFVNSKGQVMIHVTALPGTDHNAYVCQLGCSLCGYIYGANSTDVHLRNCPQCGGGAPGLEYEETPEVEQSESDVSRSHRRGNG